MTWSPPDTVVSDYRVYRDGNPLGLLSATSRSVRDRNARPGTHHTYRVDAVVFPLGTVARAVVGVRTSALGAPGWTARDVAPGRLGSLALDAAGSPHVLLLDPAGDLVYGRSSGDAFVFETVEAAIGRDRPTSLGVAAGGVVHAAWRGPDGDLRYSARAAGAWSVETVAPGDVRSVALRIESSGDVLVAFGTFDGFDAVRLARLQAGAWTTEHVSFTRASRVGLARARDGRLHVGHVPGDFLYDSIEDGGGFADRTLVEEVRTAAGPEALADGSVVFALLGRPSFDVKLALVDEGASIRTETIDALTWIGGDISVAVDDLDGVHVAYRDASDNLRYAFRNAGGNVTIVHLAAQGESNARNRIAVDASGRSVHLLHEDRGRGWVRLSSSE